MWKRWSRQEVSEALRLWREERLSYARIGEKLGRNHSSVGLVIRREDLREEAELLAKETQGV
jgi:IS30 family transposase